MTQVLEFYETLSTDEINYQMEMEGWLPCLDNIDKLQQFLGLSDKKPIPDPIRFEKPDPLGAKQVTSQKEEDLASTLSKYSFCG